jgi:DNA-binding PadR family transcriptional regulator
VNGESLKGHLDLILLAGLQAGPAYGYALIRDLRSRTGGSLDLTQGTLYPVLHRLEHAGYLRSTYITVQSRTRRLYSITPEGQMQFEGLSEDWAQLSRGIESLITPE